MAALIARYEKEELPARYSTRVSYQSYLDNYVRPRWGEVPIANIRAMAVEDWLKRLKLAPKSKGHVRALMSTLFKCAQRWELVATNPMQLVRVKNVSKRLERPSVLTAEEFHKLLLHVREPYRTMVLIAGCLGLRASEIVGLQWRDFDFPEVDAVGSTWRRPWSRGRCEDGVLTPCRTDRARLSERADGISFSLLPHEEGWLFANPATGKPYHQEEIQKKHIRGAARAAAIKSQVGWKTFRHSFRSWLDQTDAPIGVQRELMRHASIQTTMNVYGRAMTDSKRQAHSNVVQMVLEVETADTAVRGKNGIAR